MSYLLRLGKSGAKLTTALLDRLGHHSHILTTKGSSYRSRKREYEETANIKPKLKEVEDE